MEKVEKATSFWNAENDFSEGVGTCQNVRTRKSSVLEQKNRTSLGCRDKIDIEALFSLCFGLFRP